MNELQQQTLSILEATMSEDKASIMALSKGGWEGWLQCEYWNALNLQGVSTEREQQYPNQTTRCDMLCKPGGNPLLYIELKALSEFQGYNVSNFYNNAAQDLIKLHQMKPSSIPGLALIVIPRGLSNAQTAIDYITSLQQYLVSNITNAVIFYKPFLSAH